MSQETKTHTQRIAESIKRLSSEEESTHLVLSENYALEEALYALSLPQVREALIYHARKEEIRQMELWERFNKHQRLSDPIQLAQEREITQVVIADNCHHMEIYAPKNEAAEPQVELAHAIVVNNDGAFLYVFATAPEESVPNWTADTPKVSTTELFNHSFSDMQLHTLDAFPGNWYQLPLTADLFSHPSITNNLPAEEFVIAVTNWLEETSDPTKKRR